jgi:hypothetical protein
MELSADGRRPIHRRWCHRIMEERLLDWRGERDRIAVAGSRQRRWRLRAAYDEKQKKIESSNPQPASPGSDPRITEGTFGINRRS